MTFRADETTYLEGNLLVPPQGKLAEDLTYRLQLRIPIRAHYQIIRPM